MGVGWVGAAFPTPWQRHDSREEGTQNSPISFCSYGALVRLLGRRGGHRQGEIHERDGVKVGFNEAAWAVYMTYPGELRIFWLTQAYQLGYHDGETLPYPAMPNHPSETPDSRARTTSAYTDSGRLGFLYVLSSPVLRTAAGIPIVKIGATRQHPLKRAKELSAGTGVPEGYELAYYLDFDDCFKAETLVHEHFAKQRLNSATEFFSVEPAEAVAFISALATSSAYKTGLVSQGVSGGTVTAPWTGATHWDVDTPFAELFASFGEDNGEARELTAEEQAACRELEGRMAKI